MDTPKKQRTSFSRNFWTVIVMEFLERGAYYSVLSVLATFLVLSHSEGGLGFSKEAAGAISGTIQPLLYFLPILAGALADRYGYRRFLMFAFLFLILGYGLTGMANSYVFVFGTLIIMAIGAGLFKPIITGTIARSTTEQNSSLGFGIFYWTINLGACLFPLILVPYLKSFSYSYIFYMASSVSVLLLLINIFIYKEPPRPKTSKPISQILSEMVMVLKDWRFLLMIVLYSVFWILYFQIYGSVQWYLKFHVDMTPVNQAVNSFLGLFVSNPSWSFDVEHITAFTAGTIICLQLFISTLIRKTKPLPTMITGLALGTLGFAVWVISSHAWVFMLGLFIFTIGEMVAQPKYLSYVGLIAPADKKALYMGYSFLYGVIGSGVGGFMGAYLYVHFIDNLNRPPLLWLTLCGLGVLSMVGLWAYNKWVAKPNA
ncbi:MAG: MFS transporter [Bacteroidales bacterium]|nr:MFS transporter [Bacteroidales bacterium]